MDNEYTVEIKKVSDLNLKDTIFEVPNKNDDDFVFVSNELDHWAMINARIKNGQNLLVIDKLNKRTIYEMPETFMAGTAQ